MKNFKTPQCAFLTLMGLCLSATALFAHPPASVKLALDEKAERVTIEIAHTTSAPGWHFVRKIEVSVDGYVVDTKEFTAQETSDGLKYTARLRGAKPGSSVSVTAFCSRGGEKNASITVR